MIAVAVLGILAAIAIPAFINYVQRSKSAEALTNLKDLFQGSVGYYSTERWGQRGAATMATSATSQCSVLPAVTSNTPSNAKSVIDWSTEALSFAHANFRVRDPIYYQYEINGSDGMCGHMAGEALYSFRAMGDLTGDGVTSLFEVSAGANSNSELIRSPGFYVRARGE